jgi:hypothetical protein
MARLERFYDVNILQDMLTQVLIRIRINNIVELQILIL